MIPISKETRARLKWICYKGQTYDHIINLLIDYTSDKEFRGWMRKKLEEEIIHQKEKNLNSLGLYTGTPNNIEEKTFEEMNNECPECGRVFENVRGLRTHYSQAHTQSGPLGKRICRYYIPEDKKNSVE